MAETGRFPQAEEELERTLAEQPPIYQADLFYWRAFFDLISDRPIVGDAQLMIPFQSLDTYATRYEIEPEHFNDFVEIVRHLDQIDRNETKAQRAKQAK